MPRAPRLPRRTSVQVGGATAPCVRSITTHHNPYFLVRKLALKVGGQLGHVQAVAGDIMGRLGRHGFQSEPSRLCDSLWV